MEGRARKGEVSPVLCALRCLVILLCFVQSGAQFAKNAYYMDSASDCYISGYLLMRTDDVVNVSSRRAGSTSSDVLQCTVRFRPEDQRATMDVSFTDLNISDSGVTLRVDLTDGGVIETHTLTEGSGQPNATTSQGGLVTVTLTRRFLNDSDYSFGIILRVYKHFGPSFSKRPVVTSLSAKAGDNITIVCDPEGAPYPTFRWLHDGTDLGLVQGGADNAGRHMLPNGSLVIAVVKAEHEGVYTCNVTNPLGEASSSGYLRVFTRPPGIILQPEQVVFFVPGKSVQLPCQADGWPSPTYRWTRNTHDFNPAGNDDRVIRLPDSGTIIFTRPEGRDAGVYLCSAHNPHGKAESTTIRLREVILVDFPAGPSRTMYHRLGHPLTLNCVPPESYPPAQVFWVNTNSDGGFLPLDLDDRVSMDPEGRLRFANVKASDYMDGLPYSCMAINRVLRRTTKGTPFFINPRGSTEELRPATYLWSNMDAFQFRGEDLHLKCIFAGNPTPEVGWARRDGLPWPDRAVIQDWGQELVIHGVQYEDAGTYECSGNNTMSQSPVLRVITVRVQSRPSWVLDPQDVEVAEGGTAELDFQAEGVPEPASYAWFINGVPLKDVTDERFSTPGRLERPSLYRIAFHNVTRGVIHVQCNATNKHGGVWGGAFLTVVSRPPPVKSVQVQRCRENSAYIVWTLGMAGKNSSGPVTHYTVEHNTSFSPDTWTLAVTVDSAYTTAGLSLSPWANYTFRVIAHNSVSQSAPSPPTETACGTPPAAPDFSPRNLRTLGDRKELLHILWTPMPQIQHNGEGFQYDLFIKREGEPENDAIIIPIEDWRVFEFYLPAAVYEPYDIRMRARNSRGTALEDPSTIRGFSGEDVPVVNPTNVRAEAIGVTTSVLLWDFAEYTSINTTATVVKGEFRGFKIQFWQQGQREDTLQELDISPQYAWASRVGVSFRSTLEGLLPFTTMEVTVIVMNNFYVSQPSDVFFFVTDFTLCGNGTYGPNCTETCGSCKDGAVCHMAYGVCAEGCAPGYDHTVDNTCKTECSNGTYGPNCTQTCGSCKDGAACDKTSGVCAEGCAPGYYEAANNTCITVCGNGTYGPNCTETCGSCKDGAVCHVATGVCAEGCAPGFGQTVDNTCKTDCAAGKYGQECAGSCGFCTGNEVCHHVTGHCTGCMDDLDLPLCRRETSCGAMCLFPGETSGGAVGGVLAATITPVLVVVAVVTSVIGVLNIT